MDRSRRTQGGRLLLLGALLLTAGVVGCATAFFAAQKP